MGWRKSSAHPPIWGGTRGFPISRLPSSRGLDYRLAEMSSTIDREKSSRSAPVWTGPLSLGLALLLSAPAASAASVRGRLEGFRLLQNPVWAESKNPERQGYSFREPVPTVRAEFRRPYPHIPKELCVALLAATPQKASGMAVLVRIGGGRTTPVTIVTAPGTKLVFQNTDPFKHRLYAVGFKTFSASDTGRGATREWSVPEPGVYEIRDELAPSLRMWIVSEPTVAAIGYPSLKGDFSVSPEAAGEYRLQAYFAGKKVGPEVPVKLEGGDVDLSRTPLKVVDERAAQKAAKDDAEGGGDASK
jgi:hypothetical protein